MCVQIGLTMFIYQNYIDGVYQLPMVCQYMISLGKHSYIILDSYIILNHPIIVAPTSISRLYNLDNLAVTLTVGIIIA